MIVAHLGLVFGMKALRCDIINYLQLDPAAMPCHRMRRILSISKSRGLHKAMSFWDDAMLYSRKVLSVSDDIWLKIDTLLTSNPSNRFLHCLPNQISLQ